MGEESGEWRGLRSLELLLSPTSEAQVASIQSLGDLPLVVLRAGKWVSKHDEELQHQFTRLSSVSLCDLTAPPPVMPISRLTASREMVAKISDHDIPYHQPSSILAAISEAISLIEKAGGVKA